MYSTIIIGGGIMGISTAYRLASEGVDTLVIEKSTIGYEASSRNAGGVRQQFRDPRETELAKFSVEIWKDLNKELDADLEYNQAGSLRFALTDNDAGALKEIYRRDKELGLPVELLDPDVITDVAPVNPKAFHLATYCSTDGHANPGKTCEAFARAASKKGVTVLEGQEATSISRNGKAFTVHTDQKAFQGKQIMVSAGPWSAPLIKPFGIELPLTPRKPEMAETEVLQPFLKPFISLGDLKGYGRQTATGRLHIGVRSIDAALDEAGTSHERVKKSLSDWAELFPQLSEAQVERTWTGFTNWTPDLCPIIGGIPKEPDLFVCTGFSGHGFALGPAVGIVMSDLLQGRKPQVSITALGIERFLE